MNLSQAYQGWQQMQENRELYKKTREAFRKAWFTLPTNKPCSYYTKEVLGTALAETRVIESDKAKAASVMVHVLTFAHWAEPKFNPEPDFEYGDLMEYTKGPLADPSKVASKREQDDDGINPAEREQPRCEDGMIAPKPEGTTTKPPQESSDTLKVREFMSVPELDIKRIETNTVPEPCDEHGKALPADEPTVRVKPEALARRKAELKARKSETKTEEDMEQKKTRGKQPKPVAQLDAKTLQVIKVWSSRSEAERELGACNLDRAINRKRMSAGFFWCSPEDAEGFQPNPLSKYAPKTQPKKQTNAEKQQAKVKNNFPTAVATLAPTPKPDDAPNVTNDNQRGTAAHEALEVFTDDELLEELDRRGWQGELRKVQIVTIGTK